MKKIFSSILIITVFTSFIISTNIFAQCSHPTPSAENILNHGGFNDEFGIYSGSSPFDSVQVDGDIWRHPIQYAGYYFMSYDTDNDGGGASGYSIPPHQWKKVTVVKDTPTIFWVKLPTNEDLGLISADFVVNEFGAPYDKVPCDSLVKWANIISYDDPSTLSPISVSLSGPTHLNGGETGTYTASKSGGGRFYAYSWYAKTLNASWNSTILGTNTTHDLYMSPIKDGYDIKVVGESLGLKDSATIRVLNSDFLPKRNLNTIPTLTKLYTNYPNPFNPSTLIKYDIKDAGIVSLKVYNTLGEEVATLVNENKPAGRYTVNFDASKLASGVYLYKLITNNYVKSEKMILMK